MTGSKVSLRTHDAVDPEDLIGDAEGDRNCERDEERPPQIIEKCGKEEGQTEENGCDDEETRAVHERVSNVVIFSDRRRQHRNDQRGKERQQQQFR